MSQKTAEGSYGGKIIITGIGQLDEDADQDEFMLNLLNEQVMSRHEL